LSGCVSDLPVNTDDPLESKGSYDVYVSDVKIPNREKPSKSLTGRIYFPSFDGGVSRADENYKLILLTPGFGTSFKFYERFAMHFVSHGFAVLGFDFVSGVNPMDGQHDYKARQVSYAIDYILSDQSGFADNIDAEGIGLAGHSTGAKVGLYAASIDDRITAVAALDPVNVGGPPCLISPSYCRKYPVAPNAKRELVGVLNDVMAASLIFRSAPDPLFNPEKEFNASWFFKGYDGNGLYAVPAPAIYVDMGKTPHVFYIPMLSQPVSSFLKRTMTAWFMTYLRGEPMEAYYYGDIIGADIDEGRVRGVEYRL